jgi:2'-5' RNA ligase
MIQEFTAFANSRSPFSITTEQVGHFDKSVIYLSVENNPELQNLYDQLKEFLLTQLEFRQEETGNNFKPHITLEKKLSKEDFRKGWEGIKDLSLRTSFEASHFSLMKHNGRNWEERERFEF